jgi:hypothetical protein
VLHDAGQVAEADVDHLDALVLEGREKLVAVLEQSYSLAAEGDQISGGESARRDDASHGVQPMRGRLIDRIRFVSGM